MTDHDSTPRPAPAGEPVMMRPEQAMGPQDTSMQDPGMQDADTQSAPVDDGHHELAPMFEAAHTKELQERWHDIQAAFVDDPHDAVRQAGTLNDEIVNSLTMALDERKRVLELGIVNADTEQLRIGMRQYRQMLDQILAL